MSCKFNKNIDEVYNDEKLENIKDNVFIMNISWFRKKIGKKHLLLIGEKVENIYVHRSKFFTKENHFGLIKNV